MNDLTLCYAETTREDEPLIATCSLPEGHSGVHRDESGDYEWDD